MNQEMNKRNLRTQEICNELQEYIFIDTSKNFLWNREAHLLYCRHGKAGTTTFLTLLYELSKLKSKENVHFHIPRDLKLSILRDNITTNNLVITVVRHPFTRIVSAYRNKMLNNYSYKYNIQVGIMKKFRPLIANMTPWEKLAHEYDFSIDNHPSFKEFVMEIIEESKRCFSSGNLKGCLSRMDVHWRPFYVRCNPCANKLDAIVKLETLNEDVMYLIHHLSKIYREEEESLKKTGSHKAALKSLKEKHEYMIYVLGNITNAKLNSVKGIDTTYITKRFLDLLSEEEKRGLRKLYFYDFLLFNYDPYEFDN